eukprot:2597729-Alexandrium_andersonii.AAC.1
MTRRCCSVSCRTSCLGATAPSEAQTRLGREVALRRGGPSALPSSSAVRSQSEVGSAALWA